MTEIRALSSLMKDIERERLMIQISEKRLAERKDKLRYLEQILDKQNQEYIMESSES